jgi:NitT/TauT family transport system substrate-binding protein
VFGAVTAAQANAKGADILIVGPALNNHGRWLVRGDSRFRSPKDLRGHKVASQPSNSDTFTQAAIVAALGGDDLRKDYKLLFGAPAANVALFERGDVDAIIAIEPSATKLVAGGAREIARVGDLYKAATGSDQPLLLNGRAVRAKEYAKRKADYDKVVAAYTAVNQRIQQDPTILRQFATQMGFKASDTKAIELLPERLKDVYPTTFGAAERKNLDDQLAEAVKLGILDAPPKAPLY